MSVKELQQYTYISKYARYNEIKKRRETWEEATDRVLQMHIRRYPQIEEELNWAFDKVKEKRVLGSQRALQFGGKGVERNHARSYNCITSFCDRLRFFQDAFFLLLSGSGVGFSVQKHHIAKLPSFHTKRIGIKKTWFVEDSIEGWADALGVLLSSYFENPIFSAYQGYEVEFDYSLIRPAGSLLSTSNGKAPGPEPLKKSIEIIRDLLNKLITSGATRLRPIDAYDITMHASDAVLSGGVRRSATLCLFSPDDTEMAMAKTGNWYNENPQRARSNNSVLLLRDKTTKEEFLELFNHNKEWGEPGFLWSDSKEMVVNPCCEISMWPVDETTGESGWQACNLCEINGKLLKSKKDFEIAAKAAAIIGTVQAGYSDFPYLGKITERIVRREALLGVSMTGMMENPDITFDPDIQREMADLIKTVNETIAKKIGINVAARSTCLKPSGTTSCVLGTSSGIHPHHAKKYFRHVQANNMEESFQFFAKVNPEATEASVWSANNTDSVIAFCIEASSSSIVKKDLTAIEMLERVKSTQQNWVVTGTRLDHCTQPWLVHNVSNTITIRDSEWDGVGEFIYDNRKYYAGISLLPSKGDKDYPQAPFCEVLTSDQIIEKYGNDAYSNAQTLATSYKKTSNNLWLACDAVIKKEKDDEWTVNVNEFANKFFNQNVKQATYCIKDVFNWLKWDKLKESYKDVDYSLMHEDQDNTKPMETVACAGGACLL